MCEWEECNSFDMATGSTQTVSFHYASWGEQWSVAREKRSGWSSDSVSNIYWILQSSDSHLANSVDSMGLANWIQSQE